MPKLNAARPLPVELSRTVRFAVDLSPRGIDAAGQGKHNTFAGWPSMQGLGAHYELQVRCRGIPDLATGYMMNISAIDKAVRDHAVPIIQQAFRDQCRDIGPVNPAHVLAHVVSHLEPLLQQALSGVRWRLSPYYCLTMDTRTPDRVLMSQQFEFSASHRLHVDSLSAEQNRAIFGKCNNPNGHGHNYRVEPTVSIPLSPRTGSMTLRDLERMVDQTIIQRFDHKHLNHDAAEFASLNPSVENIARVCHDLLTDPVARAGGKLERVTVWETEKTSCTYPAEK